MHQQNAILSANIEQALNSLPRRQREVLRDYFGLAPVTNCDNSYGPTEIDNALRALRNLRHVRPQLTLIKNAA